MLLNLKDFITNPAHKVMPIFQPDGTTVFTVPKEATNVQVTQNGSFLDGAPHPYQHTLYITAEMPDEIEHFEQYVPEMPVKGVPGAFVNMYIKNDGTTIE